MWDEIFAIFFVKVLEVRNWNVLFLSFFLLGVFASLLGDRGPLDLLQLIAFGVGSRQALLELDRGFGGITIVNAIEIKLLVVVLIETHNSKLCG